MSIIKQLSVYDGSQWKIDDIGAQASNVTFSGGATILGKSNVQEALSALGGSSALTGSRVVVTDSSGKLSTSNMTANELNNISTELGNKVPATRTVNGKALNSDITLSATDVGAASTSDITAINNTISTINTNLGNKVNKAGDTMTGHLTLTGNKNITIKNADETRYSTFYATGFTLPPNPESTSTQTYAKTNRLNAYMGDAGLFRIRYDVKGDASVYNYYDFPPIKPTTHNATANMSTCIKSISRSGKTFTATRMNDTTFTFTQQNTTIVKQWVDVPIGVVAADSYANKVSAKFSPPSGGTLVNAFVGGFYLQGTGNSIPAINRVAINYLDSDNNVGIQVRNATTYATGSDLKARVIIIWVIVS